MATRWFESFYVFYGDEFVFRKQRKYILKPSEACKIYFNYGGEHVNIMKVTSLGPFRAYHLNTKEKNKLLNKLAKRYKIQR